ncbi:MAG: tyrosine--tRNA ligase [Candidatus Pacebacteria bacterium]|nr:tyrosine--tRNA ligase [Candidatus Paceibacterota bacterium]
MSKDLLTHRVVDVIDKKHLEEVLASGKKLRVKYGADPTAPDLHLGHAVGLRKLKAFQDLGHQIVFIIGDYTAQIGDPSGRSKARPVLTEKEVKANAKSYFEQVGKILDVKKLEIVYNSKWFKKMDFASLIKLLGKFTVQRILERDDFAKRIKGGIEVYAHEIIYPIMQAYDSIMVKSDVEMGGEDQIFNMLAGRELQKKMGEPEQDVITIPLLVGTDGQKKMSKSMGNYIGITEKPDVMFGKVMSVPDELISHYYDLCTDVEQTIKDPREAKLELARIIVEMYHGKAAAEKAKEEFIRVVSNKGVPSEIPTMKVKKGLKLADLLVEAKMAASKSEARRLIEQKGVRLDGKVESDPNKTIDIKKEILLQVGPRKFLKIIA